MAALGNQKRRARLTPQTRRVLRGRRARQRRRAMRATRALIGVQGARGARRAQSTWLAQRAPRAQPTWLTQRAPRAQPTWLMQRAPRALIGVRADAAATPPPWLVSRGQAHTSTQMAKTRRNARSSLSVGRLRGEMHYFSGILQRITLFRKPRAGKTAPRRRRKRPTPAQNRAFRQYLATQKIRACISMIICQTKEGREAKSDQCARNTPHAQRTTYWREERERATAPRSPERTSVATMHTRSGAIYNSGMQYRAS